jgi:hypothetical protein
MRVALVDLELAAMFGHGSQNALRSTEFSFDDLRLVQTAQRAVQALGGTRTRGMLGMWAKEVRQQTFQRLVLRRRGVARAHAGDLFEFICGTG